MRRSKRGFLRQYQGRGFFCDGPRGVFCDGTHGESFFCDVVRCSLLVVGCWLLVVVAVAVAVAVNVAVGVGVVVVVAVCL